MEKRVSFDEPEAVFFPLSSFPFVLGGNPELQQCFVLEYELKPGWIIYNSNNVSVLSSNEMFRSLFKTTPIWHAEEQLFKVKSGCDFQELKNALNKPVLICATRRQDSEALINGFDTDFALLLDPTHPLVVCQMKKILDEIEHMLRSERKFYMNIDFTDLLESFTPNHFRKDVVWLNCSFSITNHSKPNGLLQLNSFWLWSVMLPCFLLFSLPYRALRKVRITDKNVQFQLRPTLQFCPATELALHFFYCADNPWPGHYLREKDLYVTRFCSASELESLLCWLPRYRDKKTADITILGKVKETFLSFVSFLTRKVYAEEPEEV